MTQPPLSRKIKLLEEELSVKLFHRNKHSVQISEPGKLFVKEAKKILNNADSLKQKMISFEENKKFTIGYMGFSSVVFITDLTLYLVKKGIDIKLIEFLDNKKLIEAVENKNVDFAFHYPLNKINTSLTSKGVYKEPLVLFMDRKNDLFKKENIEVKDLSTQKYIMPFKTANPKMIEQFYFFANQAGFKPDIKLELSSHQSRLEMVSKGLGVTFDGISVQKLNIPNLVYKKLPKEYDIKVRINLAWLESKKHSLIINSIINFFSSKEMNPFNH